VIMKIANPTPRQTAAIVQAMAAVVSAEGRIPPEPIAIDSIVAIQRHLLDQNPPIACVPGPLVRCSRGCHNPGVAAQ